MKKAFLLASAVLLLAAALLLARWRDATCAKEIVEGPMPKPLTASDVQLENGDVDIGAIEVRNHQIVMVKQHRRYCAERARSWLGTLDNL